MDHEVGTSYGKYIYQDRVSMTSRNNFHIHELGLAFQSRRNPGRLNGGIFTQHIIVDEWQVLWMPCQTTDSLGCKNRSLPWSMLWANNGPVAQILQSTIVSHCENARIQILPVLNSLRSLPSSYATSSGWYLHQEENIMQKLRRGLIERSVGSLPIILCGLHWDEIGCKGNMSISMNDW